MAHELHTDSLTGEVAMFAAGNESVWHGLGQRTLGAATWDEAIKAAHLDWEVEKRQLRSDRGVIIPAYGTFRKDTDAFLGCVGDRYTPIQNKTMGDSLDLIVQNVGGAHYETAGALGEGQTVWAMVKIPELIKVGQDISENYILFSNKHDGKGAAMVKLTSTRVVCQNTLTIAAKGAGTFFKIAHYPTAERKIDEMIKAVSGVSNQIIGLNDVFNTLANKMISVEEFNEFLEKLIPTTLNKKGMVTAHGVNKKALITEIFEKNDGNAFIEQRGTMFNALNAVTNYVDHNMSVKGEADKSRAQSALFGAGEALKFFALTEIAMMAGISKEQLNRIM
jgi:phage/plasmid-like protein (TIGR03299 family)